MRLFARAASVTLHDLKVETSGNAGLQIKFKVKQTMEANHNTADASIYNLAPGTRGRIISIVDRIPKTKPQFVIEAGYIGQTGTVFLGTAVNAENKRLDPGWETQIAAADGDKETRRVVNRAISPGSVVADAIAAIADAMGADAAQAVAEARAGKFDGAVRKWSNGMVLAGTARSQMDVIAKSLGVEWSIVDGRLLVQFPTGTTAEQAVLLTRDTGLIGSPSIGVDSKRPGKKIVKAKSLLQAGLRPGRKFVIRSTEFDATCKCVEVEHSGDTHGNEWFSDVVGVVI